MMEKILLSGEKQKNIMEYYIVPLETLQLHSCKGDVKKVLDRLRNHVGHVRLEPVS